MSETYCRCLDGEVTVRPGMDPIYQANAHQCVECGRVVMG